MANGTWPRLRGCLALSAAAIVLLSGCTGSATTLPSSAPLTPGGSFVGTVTSEGDGSATGSPASSPTPSTASSAPVGPSSLSSPLGLGTPPQTSPAPPLPSTTSRSATSGESTASKSPTSPTPPASTPLPPGSESVTSATTITTRLTPPSVSVGTSGLSTLEITERKAIEKAWFDFWDVYLTINNVPAATRSKALSSVAIDPIKTQIITSASLYDKEKKNTYGKVEHRLYWGPPVDGQKLAIIGDCMDTSHYGTKDARTGRIMTEGYIRDNTREVFSQVTSGEWRLQELQLLDQSC